MNSPQNEYRRRLELRRASLAKQERRHRSIGNLRFLVFIMAVVIAWFVILHSQTFSPLWLFVPAAAFVSLVVLHSRVLHERDRHKRAVAFFERGFERLEGRWRSSGEQGQRFIDSSHPYAEDLDLFGEGSLFQLLCSARTLAGEEKLSSWLKASAAAEEVRSRQGAVAELSPNLDLREDLAVLGAEVGAGMDVEALATWGADPPSLITVAMRVAAAFIAVLTVSSLVVWILSGDHRWFLIMLLVETVFIFRKRRAILHIIDAVEKPGRDLALLSLVLARLEQERFTTQRLKDLHSALASDGLSPSNHISRLNRLLVLLDSRRNLLFKPIAAILLWEAQFAYAIESWRKRTGPAIAGWMAAVAELEALSALAGYAYEHPEDPFPEICDESPYFVGEGLGHPLMDESKCVRNDMRLTGEKQALVVSGSNMSGKSTLLRTVGTNAVLALAGAPVRAIKLRISPLNVGASIRTLDSLQEGSSRFYTEIKRLRKLTDLAQAPLPLLFLLDELLQGTNSHDRRIGAEAIVRGLVRRGSIGLLTTHDLALAKIADALAPRTANVHFEDRMENGKITFDYRIHPGVVHKSNALELMRSIGLEV